MKYTITLLISLLSFASFSQTDYPKADELFNESKYQESLKLYLDYYQNDSSDTYLNQQIGFCYSKILYLEPNAIPFFEKSLENKKNKKNDKILFAIAIAYMHNNQFEKAKEYFNETIKNSEDEVLISEAETKIKNCENAISYTSNPKEILFINQGKKINSEDSEINPFITKDEKLLIYSSNNKVDYDIFINLRKKFFNSWTISQEISKDVNTSENQIVSGIDDYAENVFYYNDVEDPNIRIIEFKDFLYTNSSELGENINSLHAEKGITTIGLDTLIFSSNRPGGFGGYDFYYSIRLPNGNWGLPINVGDKINTEYDEIFPSYSSDNQTLYFSSNRTESMGGFDIFSSKWNTKENDWKLPKNLGYPLNNTYDNNSISFLEMERYAYISRFSDDSFGKEDIYKAVFKEEEPQYLIYKIYIDVYDPESKDVKPITEFDTNIEIQIYDLENDFVYGKYTYNTDKEYFVISLPPGIYSLQVSGEKYYEYEKNIFVEERMMEETLDDLKIELELK